MNFLEFYCSIHGTDRKPYRWQTRLAEQIVADAAWPDVIDVPTGCGKTSVLDIAAFLHVSGHPVARRRIVLCVDRRLVVDEAWTHAQKIQAKYGAFEVLRLRGGLELDNSWANDPTKPAIILSTVDQTGSRLLFRGYQVSDRQRPIHAGLLAYDTLLIVDEAHLSRPFLDTVHQVSRTISGGGLPSAKPLIAVEMTATPAGSAARVFTISDEEKQELRHRLAARKLAALVEVPDSQLPAKAAEHARRLAAAGETVVGVVVNQVRTARQIYELLKKEAGRTTILLTGRIRPFDRKQLEPHIQKIHVDSTEVEPYFVVATQTVEVGANINFDALVTEAAPLPSLRQRFGRLNRLGKRPEESPAPAVVIKRKARGNDEDPVYGGALVRTWEWLSANATESVIDFGFGQLSDLLRANPLAPEPPPLTLPILPGHLEAWMQTNPRPTPDPDVAPFLHEQTTSADVYVVWRDGSHDLPPRSEEALAVPVWAVRQWLLDDRRSASEMLISDQEGAPAILESAGADSPDERKYRVWDSEDQRLRPGVTIIVKADLGGNDRFGWRPESVEPVEDVGLKVALSRPGRLRLRIAATDELKEAVEAEDLATVESVLEAQLPPGDWHWRIDRVPGFSLVNEERFLLVNLKVDGPPAETDTEDSKLFQSRSVSLADHTAHVKDRAQAMAEHSGLSHELTQDFLLAAELHDLGKADPRFQLLLRAAAQSRPSRRKAELPDGVVFAKAPAFPTVDEFKRAAARVGYPQGGRHEFLSAAMAQSSPRLADARDKDLVLHLVGTHHGYGRAFAPDIPDPEPVDVPVPGESRSVSSAHGLANLDSDWSDRFFRLNRKYGVWGLAYLEALFRRADTLASAEEDRNA